MRFQSTLNIFLLILLGNLAPAQSQNGQAANGAAEKFAGWNIEYRMAESWQVSQTYGRLQVLTSGSHAGHIFIAPGMYSNINDVMPDLGTFLQGMNLTAYPVDQLAPATINGKQGLSGVYTVYDQMGKTYKSRVISVFTPHGTGVNLVAMVAPDKYEPLAATLENIAASIRATAPTVNQQAVAALAGRWVYYDGAHTSSIANSGYTSRSYQENVYFDGRGNYQWSSSGHVSVDSRVTAGGYSSGASNFNNNSDQGTYHIIGNVLIVKGRHGQFVYDIVLQGGKLIAGGKTYLRE